MIRNKLEQKKGQRDRLLSDISKTKYNIKKEKRNKRNIEDAQIIIQTVAQQTQKELEYSISELASLALSSVFDDPYELKVDFVIKRGKTEADIYFERDGKRRNPLAGTGLGTVNVATFALRATMYSLSKSKPRPIIICDEPFIRLKGNEPNYKALNMVKEISKELGIQIIMVSDERVSRDIIADTADRLFEVSIKKGISNINAL